MNVKEKDLASEMAEMHPGNDGTEMGTKDQENCGHEKCGQHHWRRHWRHAMMQQAMMAQVSPVMNAGMMYGQPMCQSGMQYPMMGPIHAGVNYDFASQPAMMMSPKMWHRLHKRMQEEKFPEGKHKSGGKHGIFESCNEEDTDEEVQDTAENLDENIPVEDIPSGEDTECATSDAEASTGEKKHGECKKGWHHHWRHWRQLMCWKMMQAAMMNQMPPMHGFANGGGQQPPMMFGHHGFPMQNPMIGQMYAGTGLSFQPQAMPWHRMMFRMWKKMQKKPCQEEQKSDEEKCANFESSGEDECKEEATICGTACDKNENKCHVGKGNGHTHQWRQAMHRRMMQSAFLGQIHPAMYGPNIYGVHPQNPMPCPRMMHKMWKKMQKHADDKCDHFKSSKEDNSKERDPCENKCEAKEKKCKRGCGQRRQYRQAMQCRMMMKAAMMGQMGPFSMREPDMAPGFPCGQNMKHMKEMWKKMQKKQCKSEQNETDQDKETEDKSQGHDDKAEKDIPPFMSPWMFVRPHMHRHRCGRMGKCRRHRCQGNASDGEEAIESAASQSENEEWEEVAAEQTADTNESESERSKKQKYPKCMCPPQRRGMRMMRRAMMMQYMSPMWMSAGSFHGPHVLPMRSPMHARWMWTI